MPNISICIEMLFREVGFNERPGAVARAGFRAVEFWGSGNKDIGALRAACEQAGVEVATFGALGGHALVTPQSPDALKKRLEADAEIARRLGTKTLLVTVGNEMRDVPRERQHASIVANLKSVAPVAEALGVRLAVEPLNTLVDHAGYFLATSKEGFGIVGEVGSPAVGLLYDVYHMQIMEGNLIQTIRANVRAIYHVHVGDVPGRHEPGTGEINYANVFRALDEAGYQGWCGMEFAPTGSSAAALERMRRACALT